MSLAKTFCSAPWFQLRLDWDGKYRPCCVFDENQSTFSGRREYSLHDTTMDEWMSSEYSQYLREELTKGNCIPECSTCWQDEDHGLQSVRQTTNNTVTKNLGQNLDNTWVGSFLKKTKDYQSYHLVSAEAKLSNVCNFSCAMCNPKDSSKIYDQWTKDQSNQFVQEKLSAAPTYFTDIVKNYQNMRGYQHLKDILAQPIQHIKVLGGEPLLDKTLFEIFADQSVEKKSQINLHFVTNGSQDLISVADTLAEYRSVNFVVSLEGIDQMQDYARAGSHWSTVESNILSAKQKGLTVSIHHTLQAITILKLSELIAWCKNNQIPINYGVLSSPDYLSISILPDNIRHIIKNTIIDNSVNNLVNSLPIIPGKYPKFLEYISWYEKDFVVKLQDLCPELYFG